MATSDFQKHPSISLNDLYKKKRHQGADPAEAKILFVGRDPNWAADVESKEMFKYVSEYLTDGITFWKTHNMHHPFLLPTYKGNGRKYHKFFSKLNLDSGFSNKISFVELIGFPTTGMAKKNNKLFLEYVMSSNNRNHLIELDSAINNPEKIIFIAWGLIEDFKFINKETGLFGKFAKLDKSKMDINDLNQFENIFIMTDKTDKDLQKMSDLYSDDLAEGVLDPSYLD